MVDRGRNYGGNVGVGVAEALLGEIRLGRSSGRVRTSRGGAGGFGGSLKLSPRARVMWQVTQSSSAAVLKKIPRGGTKDARGLKVQMNYLFSKAEAVFGNMIEHDPQARSIDPEGRERIVAEWSEDWRGAPKNGHTTHLLISFPAFVKPAKAKIIAEAWAAEMFQSGVHQDEEWAYVAALHTDRAHPHVHIVVNNRGLTRDAWFYMAKDHAFNLKVMKDRLADIAEEEGVYLDCSSRIERGILSYGPSRAEIERRRRDGVPVAEIERTGPALEAALSEVRANAAVLKDLAMVAGLTGLPEVGAKMRRAAEVLERGGVIHPMRGDESMAGSTDGRAVEAGKTRDIEAKDASIGSGSRRDLEAYFGDWMKQTEAKIATLSPERQAPLRKELYEIASDVVRTLGDARGAELMREGPKTTLYATEVKAHAVKVGASERELPKPARDHLVTQVRQAAVTAGIEPGVVEARLARPAATAFEERDWIKMDLKSVAARQSLDLGRDEDRTKAAKIVDGFYETAARLIDTARGVERPREDQTLKRALTSMARVHGEQGSVRFENEDQVRLFAADMAQRYGAGVIRDLAQGKDQALAKDIVDPKERLAIARAVVAAAVNHESMGLSLAEARSADRALTERARDMERTEGKERSREPQVRSRDRDRER